MRKLLLVLLVLYSTTVFSFDFEKFQAKAAQNALKYSLDQHNSEYEIPAVYTAEILDELLESESHIRVIKDIDMCQFTPDIEDFAKIVTNPVFQLVFSDMLRNGICVVQDPEMSDDYLSLSLKQGYKNAYFRKAELVEDDELKLYFYKHSAILGSKRGMVKYGEYALIMEYPRDIEKSYQLLKKNNLLTDDLLDRYKKQMPVNKL